VAQDLHANGAAEVTMIQRSPTCVVTLVPSGTMVYALYSEGPPNDDIDLITAAIPYPVLRETYQWLTKRTCALDQDLLDRLHAVGFETDYEPDGTGFHMKYLRKGGGYYINVGCSDLIADGEITVRHAREIERFEPNGLRFSDGTVVHADLVVLATGYANLQEGVRRLLGDEVAERVGPIWGFDEHGAMRNMWHAGHGGRPAGSLAGATRDQDTSGADAADLREQPADRRIPRRAPGRTAGPLPGAARPPRPPAGRQANAGWFRWRGVRGVARRRRHSRPGVRTHPAVHPRGVAGQRGIAD
jgi:hypothetical protein